MSEALTTEGGLCGRRRVLADFAIAPFVRQMARHDPGRFQAAVAPSLCAWLDGLLGTADFAAIMTKPS